MVKDSTNKSKLSVNKTPETNNILKVKSDSISRSNRTAAQKTEASDTAKRQKKPEPFKATLAPKTKLNLLTISTGDDVPFIRIDSTNKYSYSARNLGGVYFWTDCLDCNWFVSINERYHGKQGVIVANQKPKELFNGTSIYQSLFADTEYKLIIYDGAGNGRFSDSYWPLIVQPGQTKIIYIGKKLPVKRQ